MSSLHQSPKRATNAIAHQNKEVQELLPFANTTDFENASYGHIKDVQPPRKIRNLETNEVIWEKDSYQFLEGKAPDTANPSLWRQSQLNAKYGLFQVAEKIYQVRGLDLSNTTFIESDNGIIVIDTLTCVETAKAALKLYRDHRGDNPIKAIIYTHSHVDHFGGVKGMVTEQEVESGEVKIFAPDGFMEHAVSENVYAGTAMARRAVYMYGSALPKGPSGQIGAGLGQTTPAGTVSLIAPTHTITKHHCIAAVDNVIMEFQLAPNTEAPSEMLIYFPDLKALCASEDATHTFHNLVTLRGAQVRDAHGWSQCLTETISRYSRRTDVLFASHHWPTWGTTEVCEFLTQQRDLYAYVHDQTLRMINQGLTGMEIAERMVLPPTLRRAWHARGYYGTVSHNVKAIYQRYMGWFDGNPAHLWEHPPVENAKLHVKLAGGIDKLIEHAKTAFQDGDFRWAAQLLNHAVFAHPKNEEARKWLANTYEQLGYGSESGPWRNFYISGATELREGKFESKGNSSLDVIMQLEPTMVFDSLAVQINGPEAWNQKLSIEVVLTGEEHIRFHVWLSNGALLYQRTCSVDADVKITTTTKRLPLLIVNQLNVKALEEAGMQIQGDKSVIERLGQLLDPGNPNFNIVTP